ncbi:CAP domain-containing protein [Gaiella sp.]|uniref:CAP domain-containing protein n=1 Tax=Gaiella sp. TaxID=2663207 RepID=UPI0032636D35
MKRALLLLGVVAAFGVSFASPAMAADAAPAATERLKDLDQQVLAALNKTRSARGLRPLVISDDLQDAAVAHSRAMLEKGFFAHDSPGGAPFAARVRGFYRSAGYDSWTVGENLIYNTDEITAEIAMAAWMASPGHRKNILTPGWREVGIGSLRAPSAGGPFVGEPTWVITLDFGARSGQSGKQKAAPKPTVRTTSNSSPKGGKERSSGGKLVAKSDLAAKRKAAKLAKKLSVPKAKRIDRVLPHPMRNPENESDDPAAVADENLPEIDVPADEPEDDVSGMNDSPLEP